MSSALVPLPPKVPPDRRAAAFAIDTLVVWLPSLILGGNWLIQTLLFLLLWIVLRVFLTAKNQGQSLGHWALDMRVVDTLLNRTPGIQELCKREALLGTCTALATVGLGSITNTNAAVLLLMLPLALDGGVALADTQRYRQAFHDRIARTIVVGTRRGYSLDLKLKKLLDQLQQNMRR